MGDEALGDDALYDEQLQDDVYEGRVRLLHVPVRRTFVHYDVEGAARTHGARRRCTSSPGKLMDLEFRTKHPAMEIAHLNGSCKPCAYFKKKGDGCRQGEACQFCHLCDENEIQIRKRAKVKELKAQWKREKEREQEELRQSTVSTESKQPGYARPEELGQASAAPGAVEARPRESGLCAGIASMFPGA
mmetsp:Transcript_16148/g.46175  ORF Transcript_16148/g.46175 Transcript_16148/m.46175 type:complete len:189 (+) Transcript_16148:144-710(+)